MLNFTWLDETSDYDMIDFLHILKSVHYLQQVTLLCLEMQREDIWTCNGSSLRDIISVIKQY